MPHIALYADPYIYIWFWPTLHICDGSMCPLARFAAADNIAENNAADEQPLPPGKHSLQVRRDRPMSGASARQINRVGQNHIDVYTYLYVNICIYVYIYIRCITVFLAGESPNIRCMYIYGSGQSYR